MLIAIPFAPLSQSMIFHNRKKVMEECPCFRGPLGVGQDKASIYGHVRFRTHREGDVEILLENRGYGGYEQHVGIGKYNRAG